MRKHQIKKGYVKQQNSRRRDSCFRKCDEINREIILSTKEEIDFPVPIKWIENPDFFCDWEPDFRSTKGKSWKNKKIQRQWQRHLDS